jgi:hypothetical protein
MSDKWGELKDLLGEEDGTGLLNSLDDMVSYHDTLISKY